MKDISVRLSELEAKIKSKNAIPVLIVDEKTPGVYTYGDNTFTREELSIFCQDHKTEVLIIDDIRRNNLG